VRPPGRQGHRPHEDFLAKIRACRYAFLELGVEDGIIVARTDSLGAGLTKQIAVTHEADDIGDKYNNFLDGDYIESADDIANGDVVVKSEGKLLKVRSACESGLFCFKEGTGEDRVVLDCITSLQNGADLLWIETEKPHVGTDRGMVNRIREGRAECQAGVQQLAVLQLDAELPPAGVRCLERRGQGRLRL
jgi:isocitrate lyase